ncbi:MAG: DUF5680 domain-containing protein [Candidatus Saccharimonadales bacterium]
MAKLPIGWLDSHAKDLLEFIYASFQHRYKNGTVDEDDTPIGGEPSFEWEKHDWRYQDWFWGGEPFSGIIVVSWRESPARDWIECWTMTVQGRLMPDLSEQQITDTYKCLDEALKAAPQDCPYRGPEIYRSDERYIYSNGLNFARGLTGFSVERLTGVEFIDTMSEGRSYECNYSAQVINVLY